MYWILFELEIYRERNCGILNSQQGCKWYKLLRYSNMQFSQSNLAIRPSDVTIYQFPLVSWFFLREAKGGGKAVDLFSSSQKKRLDSMFAYVKRTRACEANNSSSIKTVIVTDHEVTFHKLQDCMKWAEVTQSAPDQHAKSAENKIDTVERKVSAILVSLPYKLPFS